VFAAYSDQLDCELSRLLASTRCSGNFASNECTRETIVITASSSKRLNVLAWVLQVLIGSLFLFAGASKLLGASEMVAFFDQVGFGQWLRYFFGVVEVGSAAALFLPRQAFYGALILFVSLVGHVIVHSAVVHRSALFLFLLLALTALIAFLRRPPARRLREA